MLQATDEEENLMNELFFGLIVMTIFGTLPCTILGYLIAVKQIRSLIAGWDESKISNPAAYAKWLGYSVFAVGIAIGGISIIWYLGVISEIKLAVLLGTVTLIPIQCLFIANSKYAK